MTEFGVISGEYKKQFIEDVLNGMEHLLDNKQLSELNKSLYYNTNNLDFADNPQNHDLNYQKTNEIMIKQFIKAKKTKGLSKNTIVAYSGTLKVIESWAIKSFLEMTSEDLKDFFIFYQEQNNCTNVTLNNVRRNLSSFFRFLCDEEKILINPMLRVPPFKEEKRVKKAYTYEEIERMRAYLNEKTYTRKGTMRIGKLRMIAMFELFLSSGIRNGELRSLERDNINFEECKAIVLGKGNKEREVYFSERAKYYMLKYLEARGDDIKWMFVAYNKNHSRRRKMTNSDVEANMVRLSKATGVKAHAHKFRRTFCSNVIKKGMPIDQVQKLMGHESLETTLRYLDMDTETIEMTHKKYTNF